MTRIKRKNRDTIVVDFSRGSINMAAAESAGEAVRFRGITQIGIEHLEDDGRDPDDEAVVRLLGAEVDRRGWRGMPAACLLSRSVTSTQSFLFPPMPDADLRSAIGLKLSETLHFGLDEARFDFRRVRERQVDGSPQVLTLVAVAKTDAVERAVAVLRRAGLKPTAVSAASESLANLTYYASPCDAEDATVHIDVGAETTILNLFEGRYLRFSREIETAGDSFTEALMRPVITPRGPVHLSRSQAVEVLATCGYPHEDQDEDLPHGVRSSDVLPLIEPVAQRLSTEIRQSASYLAGILERPKIDYIVLSGAKLRGLDAQLEESLDVPVVSIDPVARAIAHWRLAICDEPPVSPAYFSAILGYSLGSSRSINLMQREPSAFLAPPTLPSLRRVLAPTALAAGAALSLAAIPLQRGFNTTYDRLEADLAHLDRRLAEVPDPRALASALHLLEERVRVERGIVPHWIGIMAALSDAMPENARIDSLTQIDGYASDSLEVQLALEAGTGSFEAAIAQLSAKLGESPFLQSVRVVDAERPAAERAGKLELSLELVDFTEGQPR